MLFAPHYKTRRRPTVVIPDAEVKSILSRARLMLRDGFIPIEGRIIGWKRTHAGPLGAVVVNPLTGARSLWGINFATGRPRQLKRLI